jgi:hypothetical protein
MSWKIHMRTVSHHVTWFLGRRFPNTFPLTFVIGYPKSGTTWASQLVADYLQLPFPRNSLLPVGCAAVVHGHETVRRNDRNVVYLMRDGRDALVSQYFYHARPIAEGDHPTLTARQRRLYPGLVNKADIRANLAGFVARQMKKANSSNVNWGQHVRSYFEADNANVVLLRYEDLLEDGVQALSQAMAQLTGKPADTDRAEATIRKFAFKQQSGRAEGTEDRSAFLRKGKAGDWINHFTRQAAQIFDQACGDDLVRAGYEPDRSWVSRITDDSAASSAPATESPA